MAKKKRIRMLAIVGAVLVVAGFLVWRQTREEAIPVNIQQVARRTIVQTVTASGSLQPETEVAISADVSGQIVELNVREGQKVSKGQRLARIEPDTYQAALERAQASLNTALAQLENARAQVSQQKAALEQLEFQYQRNQALYEKGAISRGEFEQIRSNYRSAEARLEAAQQTVQANRYQVQSAQANVREARENLNRTEIFAPIDGYVSRLNVESGERVVGTAQMEGTEMMRIADLNVMEALVEVNENDIVRLELGDSATVEVDALDNGRFDAVVTELANSAKQTTGVTDEATSFEVKLRVLRASYESRVDSTDPIPTPFRPGMSALVEIRTNRKKDVLSVPILAVTTRNLRSDSLSQEEAPSGDSEVETVVFARQGDKAQRRRVVTGIQDDTYIEIKEGLQEGVEIVSGPYNAVSNALRDGETIRLRSDQKKLRATR